MNRMVVRARLGAGAVAVLCSLLPSLAAGERPWQTIVVGPQSESERLAVLDLQRYLAQAGGSIPRVIDSQVWQAAPCAAVVVGTADGHPLLKMLEGLPEDLGEQGYYLANQTLSEKPVVLAVANSGEGAVHAVYGLLRELRFGFFLGSEAVPDALPDRLPTSPVIRRPVFAVRGVLPWYNFFNSPTAWDPIDHRAFVDQLIRSGANFVGFHSYDSEPFAAYEDDRMMQWGERLLNTRQPTWGTHPMPTKDFAFGSGRMFADDYFGAASTLTGEDRNQAIRAEQDILRDALDYAHRRGLHTCLGFEINADPTTAKDREVFLRRVNRVLDQYPALDYLWIWQPETQGVQGFAEQYNLHILRDRATPGSALDLFGIARRDVFRRIVERTAGERPFLQDTEAGKAARAREGARLEQFAQLALHAMAHRARAPKLVISGWGGDDRLLSAEYYEGLDRLLPSDVVFSSLDFIAPRPRVDQIYNELPASRTRWPIPWLENDGDQWHPQPYVHVYEKLAQVAHQGGSQGILGIHWRTRDIEENFAFLVDYAWQPGLTAKEFFAQLARRCYPDRIAAEMAVVHEQLDALGYRWVGGGGQTECGIFGWSVCDEGKARRLEELRAQTAAMLQHAGPGTARIQWLIDVMDWTLTFRKANLAALEAESLLKGGKAQEALALLDRGDMDRALRSFACRLSTRGEYGVLATINTKAVFAWRELRNRCLAALGRPAEPLAASGESYPHRIVLPRLIGSVAQGQDLELQPVVFGAQPAWIHYRAMGSKSWVSRSLEPVRGWVQRAQIPAGDLVASPAMEIAFSFAASPAEPMAWGPAGVTVMPAMAAQRSVGERLAAPASGSVTLRPACRAGDNIPFELAWDDLPQADWYRVSRDGQAVGETAVPYFPDAPTKPATRHQYRVEAWRDGTVFAHGTVDCQSPDKTLEEKPAVKVRARRDSVNLEWVPATSLHIASFQVRRIREGKPAEEVAAVPAQRSGGHRVAVKPAAGQSTYEVVPINQAGKAGPASRSSVSWPPDLPQVASLALPLDHKPDAAKVVGQVTFGPTGVRLGEGYLEMEHQPVMELEEGMSLSFEFTADETDNMPVLISHGRWQQDGWFAQILNGRLCIRTSAGDANGPAIEKGKAYKVQWSFDGATHHLAVNGEDLVVDQPLAPRGCQRVLRIGQYDAVQSEFQFRGTIRDLRIDAPTGAK